MRLLAWKTDKKDAVIRMAELPEGLVFLPVLTDGSWTSD